MNPKNPDHDRHAAGLYQAMALRFYVRYVDARRSAAHRGGDLQGHGPLATELEASNQYREAVEKWLPETPGSIDAILALVEFSAVIAADRLVGAALRESGPVSEETDAYHQMLALASANGSIAT